MRIAFNVSPLQTGHKVRGTGFYVLHLKNALEKYFPENEYIFFTDIKKISKKVDIVHYPYFDPFSNTIPLKYARKTVVTVLDLTPIIFPKAFPAGIKGNLRWQLQKFALKHIAGIVTDSQSAKKDIQRLVGIKSKNISVAYLAAGEEFIRIKNPTDAKAMAGKQELKIKELRNKYNLPEKFALYVGDVTWNKNLPRIVEAAVQADVPLVMAGKALANEEFDRSNVWNADLITVQNLLASNKNIFRLGFVPDEDLVTLYNAASVFVMPSLYEGFGLPILEAMACGCPVITSKEASLPEVAGEAAYFVDAYSTNSIAEGIKTVYFSESLKKDLSEKGLEQVKKFSWQKTAKETISFYEKIISRK